ncbi:hypothetical protein IB655_04960 [Francisella noatunensis]|uniref:Uncharacterized protein n=1 Tax=Francisella noatunensis TaxID=657445 RepID=A0A9Q2QD40_9GAMM|nr:DUF6270 domain-containing protein [Francisella noatunensis]MBK2028512.1 hypothetical protein [Francisella noatunensis]MBK2034135.1 hypothetical protein [Francisella noatunensis]MBK2048854.1 hypothetical protein [Francisella noatunensis]MBK2050374.1 hypothetical protein [Francisella noatunensis]MBK2051678.1 hypothetical protein [Francisella noatunensis]
MITKLSVLIFGSCISRDIFEFNNPNLSVVKYYARSSFISVYTNAPNVDDKYSHKLSSAFQQRIVKDDLENVFKSSLNMHKFDILLIDLIDHRFDLCQFPDGSIATISNEFKSVCATYCSFTVIKACSNDYVVRWKMAWKEFIAQCRNSDILDKIRVNKSYLAYADDKGNLHDEKTVRETNFFLEKLYCIMGEDLGIYQFYLSPWDTLVSSSNHKWGRAPFHYIDEYYLFLAKELDKDRLELFRIPIVPYRLEFSNNLELYEDKSDCHRVVLGFNKEIPAKGDYFSIIKSISTGDMGSRVTFYIESGKSSSYKGRLSCIISINSGEFHEMDLSCSFRTTTVDIYVPAHCDIVDIEVKVVSLMNCEPWGWHNLSLITVTGIYITTFNLDDQEVISSTIDNPYAKSKQFS